MKYFLTVISFLILIDFPVFAQDDKGTGLSFLNQDEYRSIPLAHTPFSGDELPSRIDLSRDFPTPGDQGSQNSCVGWAVSYALKSFQEKIEHGWTLNNDRIFSPSFIYNQINNGTNSGTFIPDALNLLSEQGAATLSDFPYNEYDYSTRPSNELINRAKPYRADYWRVVNHASEREVKAQLHANLPVVIGALVDENFKRLNSQNNTWRQYPSSNSSGHAMIVVGYDDNKNAFKVINSWGTSWGDGGFGWIDYNIFKRAVREAYIVKDARTTNVQNDDGIVENNRIRPISIEPNDEDSRVDFTLFQPSHNQPVQTRFGIYPGMVLSGSVNIPESLGKQVQVVVKIFYTNQQQQKGAPVYAVPNNIYFRDANNQVATGTNIAPIATLTPPNNQWQVRFPYAVFGLPNQGGFNTAYFVAVPYLFVDGFGVKEGNPIPFFVRY
ncbi:MAG: hypothetical protein CL667_05510 [Balneola sp.]|jgi:hypothetical protein|nr:hypothetical protein [Balneola sp.]|tara:strand:+ start:705 stop:2021 length:1317 start_codon:yes stop_codon:yes gene_type:complete